jgi:predicted NUDIX family phosphoesterase
MSEVEQILVFPATLIGNRDGQEAWYGILDDKEEIRELLREIKFHASFRPRPEMEKDPRYKQLIPYVVFQYDEPGGETKLFSYVRGTDQGESRLHAKMSIGVGGHINPKDGAEFANDPYFAGLVREVKEEVTVGDVVAVWETIPQALINDDTNEVGRVHLGCVHVMQIRSPNITPREKSMLDARFRPLSELFQDIERLETWSQLVLRTLYAPALVEGLGVNEPVMLQRKNVAYDQALGAKAHDEHLAATEIDPLDQLADDDPAVRGSMGGRHLKDDYDRHAESSRPQGHPFVTDALRQSAKDAGIEIRD